MNKKDKIHAEANRIFNEKRDEYTPTELVILVQSQYYNIEDLFTIGANLKSENINEHIEVSERILSICNSFQNNLQLIPKQIGWTDSKKQIVKVEEIKKEVNKSLELQKAIKDFQDSPSPYNAEKLQDIKRKLENNS